jgi:TPR repeat protein
VSYEAAAPAGYIPQDWMTQPETDRKAHEARLRRLAEAGDVEAACSLGFLLKATSRMEEWAQRQAEAERWFRAAAERGHAWAAFHLSDIISDRGAEEEAAFWDDRWEGRL